MITKTAREILKQAESLANADNSAYSDFRLATTVLNNEYRNIYNAIVDNSLAYTKKITLSEDSAMPDDFYSLISVIALPSKKPVNQRQISGGSTSGYSFSNGIFHTDYYPVEITYATIPPTITAPDDILEATVSSAPTTTNNNRVSYNADTKAVTSTVSNSALFLGKSISRTVNSGVITKIEWGGEDVTDRFSRDGLDIISFQWHSPYAVVTYSDYSIWVFTGFDGTEWNYNCIFGHETKGLVYGINTDDSTGYGMLIRFISESTNQLAGGYYWAPFVPDTILEYPTNAFFTYLEYRVAFVIASLLNMSTDFIRYQMENAEIEFYKNIGGTTNGYRMNNVTSRRAWGYR